LDRKTNKESEKESKINVMCITFLFLLFVFEKGSLYCPGYHGTLYADLAGLKLKFLLTSSSKHKGTKVEGYRTVVLNLWVTAPTGTPRSTRKTHISGGLRD
ncbi:hypothetical protein LEMLEM_LOCUS17821, partial [Lemmus lemmus]